MTRRERALFILTVALSRDSEDQKLLTGVQQQFRQNRILSYMPVDYDRKTLFALLSRMQQDGFIQKTTLTGKTTLLVTPKGIDALINRYSHKGLEGKPWDRTWRIVIYDVPEKERYKREKIRIALEKFGFGMFQKSIYISPYDVSRDVRAFLGHEGLLSMATLFSASQDEFGEARALAERIYGVRALGEAYRGIQRRLHFVSAQQIPEKREAGFHKIRSEFVELLSKDPFLPKELLPEEWPFFQVRWSVTDMK